MNLLKAVRWLLHGEEGWPYRESRPCPLPMSIPTTRGEADPPRIRLGILPGDDVGSPAWAQSICAQADALRSASEPPKWMLGIQNASARALALEEYARLTQRRYVNPEEMERWRHATRGPTSAGE